MKLLLTAFMLCAISVSYSQTYYVVRHAEKASAKPPETMMNDDPPLSEEGKQRAEALKEVLQNEEIAYVFSTKTIRTRSTAEPVKQYFNLETEIYNGVDEAFISRLLSLNKNTLIVGHSNTVDEIVNKLCGSTRIPGNLPDNAYDNLFVITKKGTTVTFENRKFGKPSH